MAWSLLPGQQFHISCHSSKQNLETRGIRSYGGSFGNLTGMGSITVVPWEWERAWEWLGGNRREWQHYVFLFPTHSKPISLRTQLRERPVIEKKWPNLDILISCQLFWYQKTSIRCEFTGYLFHDAHEKQQQVHWDTRIKLAARRNGNYRRDWGRNGNKTSVNLGVGMGMGMNSWEWGNGIEKDIPAHL